MHRRSNDFRPLADLRRHEKHRSHQGDRGYPVRGRGLHRDEEQQLSTEGRHPGDVVRQQRTPHDDGLPDPGAGASVAGSAARSRKSRLSRAFNGCSRPFSRVVPLCSSVWLEPRRARRARRSGSAPGPPSTTPGRQGFLGQRIRHANPDARLPPVCAPVPTPDRPVRLRANRSGTGTHRADRAEAEVGPGEGDAVQDQLEVRGREVLSCRVGCSRVVGEVTRLR